MRRFKKWKKDYYFNSLNLCTWIGWIIIKSKIINKASQITISNLDLSNIDDGTYEGEYNITPVKVIVEVVIRKHKIYEIIILEHENGFGGKAETIIQDVIDKQDLNVDFISGVTVSSKVILKSIDIALNN